ncbi:MAG: 2-oxo acid dehydrogenase subunit E2 [Dehalococcoidia bacterium]|nr:2-oxo acid dehydrogenase subunit E2 [Dehalococcoidia bacterium]
MASDVIMPQMGFDMTEGMVVRWLKHEGDAVTRGETIAEIETDKATVELEAYESGVMARILVPEGVMVPVGETIGLITAPGEDIPDVAAPTPSPRAAAPPADSTPPTPPAPPEPVEAAAPAETAREETPSASAPVTPVARRIAEQAGVSVAEVQANVTGTGPRGRITRGDIEVWLETRGAAASEPVIPQAPAQVEPTAPEPGDGITVAEPPASGQVGIVVPAGLPPMRQAIARRMSLSKLTAPHYYVTVEIDMTRAVQMRAEINEELDAENRVTVNDLVIKAVATALRSHLHFNVTVQAEGIIPNPTIDVSIAVATDGGGLIAPSMPDVGDASLIETAARSRDLSRRAREGRLRPNEVSGVGFAVSNLGMYDVKDFVAIITPPNAGAIAVGSVQSTPVARDGQVVVAEMMSATLSADHRATDGAEGARFMNEIRRILERPSLLLL